MTAKTKPLAWAAWESTDRVIVRPDMKNETGNTLPRLLLILFANGALKVTATRRPLTMLSVAAGVARAMHTWIDSALVSEPELRLGQVAQILTKRLRLDGHRYIGEGVFEKVSIGEALPVLMQIRQIADLPETPVPLHPEPAIPSFLKKDNSMPDPSTEPVPQSTTGVVQFDFDTLALRVAMRDGEPWFVAADVCAALGLTWKTGGAGSTGALDDDEKGVSSIDTPGGQQEVTIINESGLYTLILRCRDAVKQGSAPHRFRKWVTSEVLPAIRKTGAYAMPGYNGNALPEICEGACDARAWFLFNQVRQSTLVLLGNFVREGDDERLLDSLFWTKTRLQERLRDFAARQIAQRNDPKAVAAWIMAWQPEGWRRDALDVRG